METSLDFLASVRQKLKGMIYKPVLEDSVYHHLESIPGKSIFDTKKTTMLRSSQINDYQECYFIQQHKVPMRIKKKDYVFYVVTEHYNGSCQTCRIHHDMSIYKETEDPYKGWAKFRAPLRRIMKSVMRADVQVSKEFSDEYFDKRSVELRHQYD